MFTSYAAATYLLLDVDPWLWLFYDDGILRISTIVVWMVLGLYFQDLYSNFRIRSRFVLVQQDFAGLGERISFPGARELHCPTPATASLDHDGGQFIGAAAVAALALCL